MLWGELHLPNKTELFSVCGNPCSPEWVHEYPPDVPVCLECLRGQYSYPKAFRLLQERLDQLACQEDPIPPGVLKGLLGQAQALLEDDLRNSDRLQTLERDHDILWEIRALVDRFRVPASAGLTPMDAMLLGGEVWNRLNRE